MVELKGSLGSIGLPAIVQLIGDLHHSGNLELTRGASRGVLGFDDGRLVAASFDDQRGFSALAACSHQLADADFVFVEGLPTDERTMDLSGSDLQRHLRRLASGEPTAQTLELPSVKSDETLTAGICPLLGFVDDATRHYSRPTALHRCFADGGPKLVSGQEQRELCLSGRYSACPRFRSASLSVTPSAPRPAALPEKTPSAPGEAMRKAAAGQTRVARSSHSEESDGWVGHDDYAPPTSHGVDGFETGRGGRSRRGWLLIAIGAGLGLVVLIAGLLIAIPALNGGLAQRQSNAAPQVVAQTVPTVIPAASIVPSSTPVPSPAPTSTTVPRPTSTPVAVAAAPTARSVPTAPGVGQSLLDVRFAAGPKQGWIDNPPFATWSDGAYRLQAHQPPRFVAVSAPVDRVLTNVVVSATFRKTGGPPGGGYGLVIRDQSSDPLDGINQDANAYVLATGDRGDFGVWRRDGDHWVDLVPWTPSDSVRVGGSPNDLVVRAIGTRLTFIVNATEVASVEDDTLRAGGVGVFVGGDNNEVALDRFVVQLPD
jgi:hypothetical protein